MKIEYPVIRICNVLNVKRRSYYKWVSIGKPLINNYDEKIAEIISVEHKEMKQVYGTLRLKYHIENKYPGIIMNHKKIRRYKNALGLDVIVRKPKGLCVIRAEEKNLMNKAPYLIDCNFKSEKPLEKLSSDVSYIKCTDGTLYLSAVKDFFNNEIVSFSISNNNDTRLILKSYEEIKNVENTIINTDQGSVYFSYEYVKLAERMGFKRSMSHKGRCWENCPIENWFSQLKEESLKPLGKLTKKQALQEIKKYIQWYNTERIQKKLGYLSPVQYKLQFT